MVDGLDVGAHVFSVRPAARCAPREKAQPECHRNPYNRPVPLVRCSRSPTGPSTRLTTYDAKDPATAFPPIEPLLPPAGAPNVLIVLLDDVGLRRIERVRRSVQHAGRRAACRRRSEVQPVPHDGAVRPDPPGAPDRAQPPLGRHGLDHRDRHVGAGQQLAAAEHEGTAGDDAQAQRVLDRPVRQVSRGAGVAIVADRPVRCLAVGRRWLRVLLRLHRRREQPVRPGAVRRAHTGRAAHDPRGGLPPHRGSRRPCRSAGSASRRRSMPDKPFFMYFAPGATHAPHHVPTEWSDKYTGSVRPRVGRAARAARSPARRNSASSPPMPS